MAKKKKEEPKVAAEEAPEGPPEEPEEPEPEEPVFEHGGGEHSNKTLIAAIASAVIIGGVLLYMYLNGMLALS